MNLKSYISTFLPFIIGTCLYLNTNAQQLKLGDNPTVITPSAVLELDSKNQGLLLTRILDTSNIHNPSDGMIIYLTEAPNTGIYVRKDGIWQRTFNYFQITKDPSSVKVVRTHDTVSYNIPNASSHVEGVVSTRSSGQSFGGDKTFKDSLIALGGFNAYKDAVIHTNLILTALSRTNPGYLLSTDNTGKVILQTNPQNWIVGGNQLTGKEQLGVQYDDSLSFITNGKDRMRITSDGKTGIGTASPEATLDVNGSFKLGADGSSFEKMGEGTIQVNITSNQLVNILDLIKMGPDIQPIVLHVPFAGITENAMVILNPSDRLDNLQINLTVVVIVLPASIEIANLKASIAWVRALNGEIEIALTFDFMGVDITGLVNSLQGLFDLLGNLVSINADINPINFNVLYCNLE